MKLLLLLLASFTCYGQCPEDLWKRAVLMTDEPMEVQIGKGQHMVLIVFERKDTSKVETWVVTPKGAVIPDPSPVKLKETINNNSPKITYTGTWSQFTNLHWTNGTTPGCADCKPFHLNDVAVTYGVNASASTAFTGKRIEVVAEVRNNHGTAKIEVKQGTTVVDSKTVDMYNNTTANAPATIYSKDLPQGTYTITVSLAGVSAGKDSMVFDSFKVFE